MYAKAGGALKQVTSLPVLFNGEIRDISTLYSKKDGALVTVFSSGALIEFMDYPYPIPVMAGWQYSTDGKTWTTVSEDGEIDGSSYPVQYYDFSGISISAYTEGVEGTGYEAVNAHISGIVQLIDGAPTTMRAYWDFGTTEEYADTNFSSGDALFFYDATSSGFPPNLTPTRLEVLDADGNVVQVHSISGDVIPFTGYVKAKGELSLSEYYQETGQGALIESGKRTSGSSLRTGVDLACSFVIGSHGFVAGGNPKYRDSEGFIIASSTAYVNMYDESGNVTSATSISKAGYRVLGFAIGSHGFVAGGVTQKVNSSTEEVEESSSMYVDMYDESGNRTSASNLESGYQYTEASFTAGNYGFVASINKSVRAYDESGNKTSVSNPSFYPEYSGSLSMGTFGMMFNYTTSTVDIYDSSLVKSTISNSNLRRSQGVSFVLDGCGYYCGGYYSSSTYRKYAAKIDSNKNVTKLTNLSYEHTGGMGFSIGDKGYVCGGSTTSSLGGFLKGQNYVEIYDTSGNLSTGTAMSIERANGESFVLNGKGFVLGGSTSDQYTCTSKVDIYYDEYETIYSANIPITEGSTYTLNGESGTADVSEVMTFDSKVSGTIKYKKGDLLPGVQITVVDASGNVVEGAEITIEEYNDWDLSNVALTIEYST